MSSSIWQETLGEFVKNVASSRPVPGGGAVAALSGSLAASLLKMVLEIAAKGGSNVDEKLAMVEAGLKELQHCVEADITAFNSFLAARKLAQVTEVEKVRRQELMNQALQRCTEVPLTAAQAIVSLVPVAKNLVGHAPDKVLSDLGVALSELDCGLGGLSFTVNINLRGTASDPAFARLRAEWDGLASQIASARQELAVVLDQVAQRIGQS